MSQVIKERLIGITVTLVTALILFLASSFFNSFATQAEVDLLKQSIQNMHSDIIEVKQDVKDLIKKK